MAQLKPYTTYHTIPIYLKQSEQNRGLWLQWQRGKVRYGIRVTELNEALSKAWAMIDAMLELEVLRHTA
ncbi:MAG TPA: hypothetical protein V6C63_20645 [Allocoleopsis sp.]